MKNISTFIVNSIITLFGANFGKIIGVFFISMLPIVELRGSIPVGYALGLNWLPNIISSVLGNILPVPFILIFSVKLFEYFKQKNILINFIKKIENRALSRSASIEKGEFLALMLFVAIPFPGTGAWTGAFIAALLKLDIKKSIFAISLGVIIAAILVTLGVYGIIGNIF